MVGKTISHYKILEKLGEGGMGIFFKVESKTHEVLFTQSLPELKLLRDIADENAGIYCRCEGVGLFGLLRAGEF